MVIDINVSHHYYFSFLQHAFYVQRHLDEVQILNLLLNI